MSRFIDACGLHINTDSIKSYWQDQKGTLYIEMTDDSSEKIPPEKANYVLGQLSGEHYVVQILPAHEPVYAVYREDDGSYFAGRVHYLAVCADGSVQGLDNCDGWFDCDPASNYQGIYYHSQLGQFKGIEIEGEKDATHD